jgi:murein DD-endopeptidase MepM/ murein hydrolase activator NlpD
VRVAVGSRVDAGQVIGSCGNSGNSTEPHVHLQVTNATAWDSARGLPIMFEPGPVSGAGWLPRNGEVVNAA